MEIENLSMIEQDMLDIDIAVNEKRYGEAADYIEYLIPYYSYRAAREDCAAMVAWLQKRYKELPLEVIMPRMTVTKEKA